MNRILVIGCPGSGKSVLSRKLEQITGLPLTHLDRLYHQDAWPDDPSRKREQWVTLVKSLIAEERWIIDGNYKNTLAIRIAAADTVVFLDYPRWLTVFRVLKRRIAFHRKQRPDMPPEWKEKMSRDFLKFIWSYRARERSRVLSLLEQNASGRSIFVFRHPAEAERWLDHLGEEHP